MSWDNTYSHNFLIALDQFAAAVIFNRPDLTISTMCYLVAVHDDADLKLSPWQRSILVWLGPRLDRIQTQHCLHAAQGDYDRAVTTQRRLYLQCCQPRE